MRRVSIGAVGLTLVGLTCAAPVVGVSSAQASTRASAQVSTAQVSTAQVSTAPRRVASGWITYWRLDDGLASTLAHAALFRDVSLYWYSATRRSTVVEQQPGSQPSLTVLNQAVTSLQAQGVPVFLTVNDQGLGATSMARLLTDRQRRGRLIDNLVAKAQLSGADGIDIDFESMNVGPNGADRTTVKRVFPVFLGKLRQALHSQSLSLSVALPPRTSPRDGNWEVFDYGAIAANVDRARVMTYDFSTMAGRPGPIAPITWVDSVARFASAHFGRRLSLGLPTYGYNWFVKRLSGSCPRVATAPTYGSTRSLVDLAASHHVTPGYVRSVAGYTYSYRRWFSSGTRSCRVERTVWYEDARSVWAKLAVLRRHGFGTVALWSIGGERKGTWTVLRHYAATPGP
ncbi:MAG: glycosyl hydrolase family 18 protein [Actinomycetes bacterium]